MLIKMKSGRPLWASFGFILFLAGAIFRTTEIFSEGRLWAEEGSVFLVRFLGAPFLKNLFFLHHGHLHIVANIVVASAVKIKIDYIPLAITWMGFAVQSAVVYFFLAKVYDYAGGCFVVIMVILFLGLPPTAELWANATNLQWHLGLATALILVTPTSVGNSVKSTLLCFVLLFSGLTGVPSLFWTPFYIYKARLEADPARWIQALILICTAIVQAGLMLTHGLEHREVSLGLTTFVGAVSEQMVVAPLFGITIADQLSHSFRSLAAGVDYSAVALSVSCFSYIVIVSLYIVRRGCINSSLLVAGAWLSLFLGLNGAIGDKMELISGAADGRYFFVPFSVLMLAQIMHVRSDRNVKMLVSCVGLVSCLAVISVGYWSPSIYLHGVSWKDQIRTARASSGDVKTLDIWPAGWKIHLDHRCFE